MNMDSTLWIMRCTTRRHVSRLSLLSITCSKQRMARCVISILLCRGSSNVDSRYLHQQWARVSYLVEKEVKRVRLFHGTHFADKPLGVYMEALLQDVVFMLIVALFRHHDLQFVQLILMLLLG